MCTHCAHTHTLTRIQDTHTHAYTMSAFGIMQACIWPTQKANRPWINLLCWADWAPRVYCTVLHTWHCTDVQLYIYILQAASDIKTRVFFPVWEGLFVNLLNKLFSYIYWTWWQSEVPTPGIDISLGHIFVTDHIRANQWQLSTGLTNSFIFLLYIYLLLIPFFTLYMYWPISLLVKCQT